LYYVFAQFKDIKGASSYKGYEEWVQVLEHHHESKQPHVATQQVMGRTAEQVEVGPYVLYMPFTVASPKLQEAHWGGKIVPEVTIHFTRAGGDKPLVYKEVKLTKVLVSSYQNSGDPKGEPQVPTDRVELTFETISVKATGQKPDGAPGGNVAAAWHVAQGAPA